MNEGNGLISNTIIKKKNKFKNVLNPQKLHLKTNYSKKQYCIE